MCLSTNLTICHQITWICEPHLIGKNFSSKIDHCVTCSLISDVTSTFLRQVASCIAHPFVHTVCWPFLLHHLIQTTRRRHQRRCRRRPSPSSSSSYPVAPSPLSSSLVVAVVFGRRRRRPSPSSSSSYPVAPSPVAPSPSLSSSYPIAPSPVAPSN